MSKLESQDLFVDEGHWLRLLLAGIQARLRMLPPESTLERIRQKVAAGMANQTVESKAA
ncbi:MAG: hypothetical protein WBF66_10195 [Dehalococcoidia bacterium]